MKIGPITRTSWNYWLGLLTRPIRHRSRSSAKHSLTRTSPTCKSYLNASHFFHRNHWTLLNHYSLRFHCLPPTTNKFIQSIWQYFSIRGLLNFPCSSNCCTSTNGLTQYCRHQLSYACCRFRIIPIASCKNIYSTSPSSAFIYFTALRSVTMWRSAWPKEPKGLQLIKRAKNKKCLSNRS